MNIRVAALAGIAIVLIVAACSGGGDGDSRVVFQLPTETAAPTLTSEEQEAIEEAKEESATATAEAVAHVLETGMALPSRPPPPTRTPRPTVSPPYKLALISASCTYRSTYTTCEGFVKNISTLALEDVEVVINWYDENDTPRSSHDALIDYRPILPGQTSPWSSIGTYNPALTRFRVEFKEFFGGTILTRDDRP